MKVDDLYIIVRELGQINVLQANLIVQIRSMGNTEALSEIDSANKILTELLESYDKYSL